MSATDTRVFSILLSEKTVQALYWLVIDEHIEILSQSELKYYFDENDCLIKLDECLQQLGEETQTVDQALFHLDSAFTQQTGLLPEKKDFLKKITQALSLKPVGFAANIEALEKIIAKDVPKQYHLIVEYTATNTVWTVFQDGQAVDSHQVDTTDDLAADHAQGWENIRPLLQNASPEENLSILYVSSILKQNELLNRSENIPVQDIESEFIGSAELLNKVAVPAAVALAQERGWLKTTRAPRQKLGAGLAAASDSADFSSQDFSDQEDDGADVAAPTSSPKSLKQLLAKNKLILIGAIILGLIVCLGIFLAVIAQTTVAIIELIPKKQVLSQTAIITVDPKAKSSDFDNLILMGELVEEDFTGSSSAQTTGRKKVGERAKGEVEIINKKSTSDRNFAKGTTLTAGDLKFVLDSDVTVKAALEKEEDGKTVIEHIRTTTNVTAVEVGEESNLAKEAMLKVGSYDQSEFDAQVKNGLSGGIAKEVPVVTETDQTKLQASLLEQITQQAVEYYDSQRTGQYFIALARNAAIAKKTWYPQLDQEAESVGLDLAVTVPAVAYDAADLKPLAQAILEKHLPDGFILAPTEPQLLSSANSETKKNEPVTINVDINQQAIARIETGELPDKIKGKTQQIAESVLKGEPAIATAKITYSNPIYAFFFKKLPSSSDRLTIVVQEQDQSP